MVEFSHQVAEIIGSHWSSHWLSHNIFLKFQHAIVKRKQKNKHRITMFRKILIFYLKPLEGNLPPQNKKPLENFLHEDLWNFLFIR